MYWTKEMYRTDHSAIFSTRVTTHCMVHSIMYRYKWISHPVYSKYNSGVFRERPDVECSITGKVKVILAVWHSTVYYKWYSASGGKWVRKQFTYAERVRNNSFIKNSGGGLKDPIGSQFTATTETDSSRRSVESVQKVSRPLLTPVHFKCIFFTSFFLGTTKLGSFMFSIWERTKTSTKLE
jgi:hypothetical protein